MGYPEAQYVIDSLSSTLKMPIMIHEYKMFGTGSYVYNIPALLEAMYISSEGVNDTYVNPEGFDYVANKGGAVFNAWLCNLEATREQASTLFANVMSINDLVNNSDAIAAVIRNPIVTDAILSSETVMNAIFSNQVATNIAMSNEMFFNSIMSNETRMTAACEHAGFLSAVVKNSETKTAFASSAYLQTLMPIIANTVANTEYFTPIAISQNYAGTKNTYYINGSSQWVTTELSADDSFVFLESIYTEKNDKLTTVTGLLLGDTLQGTKSGTNEVEYLFIGGLKSTPGGTSTSYDAHNVTVTIYKPV